MALGQHDCRRLSVEPCLPALLVFWRPISCCVNTGRGTQAQAHSLWSGPVFQSGHSTTWAEADWARESPVCCFIALALLMVLSSSVFRNVWGYQPSFLSPPLPTSPLHTRDENWEGSLPPHGTSPPAVVLLEMLSKEMGLDRGETMSTLARACPHLQALRLQLQGSESLGLMIWAERAKCFLFCFVLFNYSEKAQKCWCMRKN